MRWALILCLVALCAGCGGNETPGQDNTFEGGGYSFSYPGGWEQREESEGTADVVIAPELGVTGISVGVFDSPQEVTAENIDGLMSEIRKGAEQFFAQSVSGTTIDGDLEQTTIAGLPAVTFEGTTSAGDGIRTREAWIFDGTTFYAVNCTSATGNEDSVDPACDQVLETFAVD